MPFKDSLDDINKNVDHIRLPDVDLGYHPVDGYNVSDLVVWFSEVTRYGTNFKPANNVSLYYEREYAESMAIYAAMAGIVAVGLTIFLILFCCCNCMFRSAAPRTYKSKGQRGSNGGNSFFCGAFVFVIAIIGAATFVVGFIGETRLYKGAESACSTIDHFDEKAKTIQSETQKIETELHKSIDSVNELDGPIKNAVDLGGTRPEFKPFLDEIQKQYNEILKQVKMANETINDQIKQTKILDELVKFIEPVRKNCPDIAKYLRLGNLLVLIILAISSLFFIIGLCNNCFRSITTLIGYIMFNILIVFGILSFLVLIVGSDLCLHSKPLIQKHAPIEENIKVTVLDYYLFCNQTNATNTRHLVKRDVPFFDLSSISKVPALPNIDLSSGNIGDIFNNIQDFISLAQNYTNMFNGTLGDMEKVIEDNCAAYLHQQGVKDVHICDEIKKQVEIIKEVVIGSSNTDSNNSLLSRMQAVSNSVSSIVGVVNCESITPEINETLTNVCSTIYEAFFFFLVNSLAAVLCFYLLLIFSIWMLFT